MRQLIIAKLNINSEVSALTHSIKQVTVTEISLMNSTETLPEFVFAAEAWHH